MIVDLFRFYSLVWQNGVFRAFKESCKKFSFFSVEYFTAHRRKYPRDLFIEYPPYSVEVIKHEGKHEGN